MLDIYFKKEYGLLCELMSDGRCEIFEYKSDAGHIRNMFIKREIPWLVDGKRYYDISTPYGYGGPIILSCTDREDLLSGYESAFEAYCAEQNIVCEFVRFHTIYRNYEDFSGIYKPEFSRLTVATDLESFDDPVQQEFSKSARKEVRKAEAAGVTCSCHYQPDDLHIFRQLYEETMDRNNADKMYYFPDSYYEFLETRLSPYILEVRASYNNVVIGSEIYFCAGDILHAHLLGSGAKLLELNGGALIEASAARWGKENGYRFIHHGGGRTSAPDDALYLYKKKFGKHTEPEFHVGKKIWNQAAFDRIVQDCGVDTDTAYFPPYRSVQRTEED